MRTITLGSTGIKTPQNAFGALPLQRCDMDTAVRILRKAYEGGITFFDTARAYSDSEIKLGEALSDVRDNIIIATKTMAREPEKIKEELDTSLKNLKTDHVDIYQLHCVDRVYGPDDGTGIYELLQDHKRQGMIRHISVTAHKIGVAEECVDSGLYETMQFPFSYLSNEREIRLTQRCKEQNMGFIAMKGLAGGLINNSAAAFAFIYQYDNVLPIWGIQRETELDEWLSYMKKQPEMNNEIKDIINKDLQDFKEDFCRGCGYCMPCPAGIIINQCARMSLLLRRAPSKFWLSDNWQSEMKKIDDCINCGACMIHCPYELKTPDLLKRNYEDYKKVLAGKINVE